MKVKGNGVRKKFNDNTTKNNFMLFKRYCGKFGSYNNLSITNFVLHFAKIPPGFSLTTGVSFILDGYILKQ